MTMPQANPRAGSRAEYLIFRKHPHNLTMLGRLHLTRHAPFFFTTILPLFPCIPPIPLSFPSLLYALIARLYLPSAPADL